MMDEFFLGQISYDTAALLLRLMVAALILPFGLNKILKRKTMAAQFPFAVLRFSKETSFYLALFAETFAPACLILGFFTRIATLGGILNMGIAYYEDMKGKKSDFPPFYYAMPLPILLGYILILIMGPGACSLDRLMF